MISLQLLEKNDKIEPTDWCRPLSIVSMSGGYSDNYSFKSAYGGGPDNNAEWVLVKDFLGKVWFGSTVHEVTTALKRRYEFMRGPIPKSNQLDMTDYLGANDVPDFSNKKSKKSY